MKPDARSNSLGVAGVTLQLTASSSSSSSWPQGLMGVLLDCGSFFFLLRQRDADSFETLRPSEFEAAAGAMLKLLFEGGGAAIIGCIRPMAACGSAGGGPALALPKRPPPPPPPPFPPPKPHPPPPAAPKALTPSVGAAAAAQRTRGGPPHLPPKKVPPPKPTIGSTFGAKLITSGSTGCFSAGTGGLCSVLARPTAAVEPDLVGRFQAKDISSSRRCRNRVQRTLLLTATPSPGPPKLEIQ
mmetsp:Transcript_4057/g.9618  ORF Transcript_4057/g.9618 Transcript_4057/m.9618 type:complete len:242 (+) Transcript_4057:568-1293(+)